MTEKAHMIRVPAEPREEPTSLVDLPRSVDFAYSKNLFFLRMILQTIMIALVFIVISPLFLGVPWEWVAAILALLLCYFLISAVSPLVTTHTLTPHELILRQGWYFRAMIPTDEIEVVEETGEFIFTGVKFSVMDQKVYIAGSRSRLVRIRLRSPRRFFLALGKMAKEIIIDVRDRKGFLEMANQILAIREKAIRASQDQSSSLQS